MAFSPDGRQIVSGSLDKTVRVWDVADGKEKQRFEHSAAVECVAFFPDSKRVISAGGALDEKNNPVDCEPRIWDVETGKQVRILKGANQPLAQVAVSPDGRYVASTTQQMNVLLDDLENEGKQLRLHTANTAGQAWVAFSSDGGYLVARTTTNRLNVWEVATGRQIRSWEISTNTGRGLFFLPASRTVLSNDGSTPRLWDTARDKELLPPRGHFGAVGGIAWSSDGKRLLSTGADQTMRLWDIAQGRELPKSVIGLVAPSILHNFAFSPDGRYALAPHPDQQPLPLWELESKRAIREIPVEKFALDHVAFAPDSRHFLVGSRDGVLRLFGMESGKEIRSFKGHKRLAYAIGFFADGRQAFSVNVEGTVSLWDIDKGTEVRQVPVANACRGVIAADGRTFFAGYADGAIRRWDLNQKEPQAEAFDRLHEDAVLSLTLSADGKMLASCARDTRVILWEAATGKMLREWKQPGGANAVSFAPDGRHLAQANNDGTIYILRLAEAPLKQLGP